MKVYYIGSPRGIKEYGAIYKKTTKILKELGYDLISDLIVDLDGAEKLYAASSYKKRVEYYKLTMEAIKKCDIAVVEVSIHSMSMGYIVEKVLSLGKPVIVLHLVGHEPYFFSGIENEKLQICEYNESNIKQVLKQALNLARENMDVRFNFFISPKIGAYLDWVSQNKKLPRAVYLRRLIEGDMTKSDYVKKKT